MTARVPMTPIPAVSETTISRNEYITYLADKQLIVLTWFNKHTGKLETWQLAYDYAQRDRDALVIASPRDDWSVRFTQHETAVTMLRLSA